MTTNTTGPAELRRLVERNRILTPITPEEILAQAAAWEADRADLAAFCGQNERLIKAAGAETVDGAIAEIEQLRAALERARALLVELEWCGVDGWEQCPWCLGYKDSHPDMKHGHSKVCKLAAALVEQ